VLDEVGVEVALGPGIGVDGRDAQGHDPLEIVVAIDIAAIAPAARPRAARRGTSRSIRAVFPDPIAPRRSNALTPCSFKWAALAAARRSFAAYTSFSILTSMWCIQMGMREMAI